MSFSLYKQRVKVLLGILNWNTAMPIESKIKEIIEKVKHKINIDIGNH